MSKWRIEPDGDRWQVVTPDGATAHEPFASRSDAMALITEALQSAPTSSTGTPVILEMVPEGTESSDGRTVDPGASFFTPERFPLPIMSLTETGPGGHQGAELAGYITRGDRMGPTLVVGYGMLDDSDVGNELAQILTDRGKFGLSVDPGHWEGYFDCTEMDEFGDCTAGIEHATSMEIIGATACPFPAFAGANIRLDDGAQAPPVAPIVAAAGSLTLVRSPEHFPLSRPFGDITPGEITDDGAYFGYACLWGSCHIGHPDVCVTPPHSPSDYAYFRLGTVKFGTTAVRTGKVTLDTGHAPLTAGADAAASHYDHTGTQVADVVCGEDDRGLWFAGALRPDIAGRHVDVLRASCISGDWRNPAGIGLDLVAMLAVNVPGFPVPRSVVAAGNLASVTELRPRVHMADGQITALVAAGAAGVLAASAVPSEMSTTERWSRVDALEARLAYAERQLSELRPVVASAMVRRIKGQP